MTDPALSLAAKPRPQTRWPEPLSPKELDQRFPGAFDGIMLLGGAANVIMQLGQPPVCYGVMESKVESGSLFKHPFKRFRTTITYLAVALAGTTEEKLAYRQAVNRSHAQVRSTAESPVKYNAFDPELQFWVASCLYWGFADTLQKLRGPMTPDQCQRLYEFAQVFGTTLQVPPERWPADVEAFNRHWQAGLDQLAFDDTMREYLTRITDLKFLSPVTSGLFGRMHRFMTAGFLPPEIRQAMHFQWTSAHERRFRRTLRVLSRVNRTLPRPVRQYGFTWALADFRRRRRKGLPLV